MKVYAIATLTRERYSHGDFGDELRIINDGAYSGKDQWDPVFHNREDAEKYIIGKSSKRVIELELR